MTDQSIPTVEVPAAAPVAPAEPVAPAAPPAADDLQAQLAQVAAAQAQVQEQLAAVAALRAEIEAEREGAIAARKAAQLLVQAPVQLQPGNAPPTKPGEYDAFGQWFFLVGTHEPITNEDGKVTGFTFVHAENPIPPGVTLTEAQQATYAAPTAAAA